MVIVLLQRKTEMDRWKKREVLKDFHQNVSIYLKVTFIFLFLFIYI